jgi:hypothetical protein
MFSIGPWMRQEKAQPTVDDDRTFCAAVRPTRPTRPTYGILASYMFHALGGPYINEQFSLAETSRTTAAPKIPALAETIDIGIDFQALAPARHD